MTIGLETNRSKYCQIGQNIGQNIARLDKKISTELMQVGCTFHYFPISAASQSKFPLLIRRLGNV